MSEQPTKSCFTSDSEDYDSWRAAQGILNHGSFLSESEDVDSLRALNMAGLLSTVKLPKDAQVTHNTRPLPKSCIKYA